jgi:fructokinase
MRIGIDLGGTKIEVIALAPDSSELVRRRIATPQTHYGDIVSAVAELVLETERDLGQVGTVGIGIPGAISPKTGLVKNANNTKLIGHPLDKDVARALQRQVRVVNDANCFTLSEARDGAGKGMHVVFGVIVGTGVGGGICIDREAIHGAHAIAGEWGHNPLPSPSIREIQEAATCYCARRGCIESWLSGPALTKQYAQLAHRELDASDIARQAAAGEKLAVRLMEQFYDRFARSIATLVNILDPDAIVLGGGLSNIDSLYDELPARVESYAFTPEGKPSILKNVHGDSSGVRGAAWLWREGDAAGLPK